MNTPEKIGITRKNLMTRETEKRLKIALAEVEEKAKMALKAVGESAGPSSDWHDNFPFEQANRDFELYSSEVTMIKKQLENREIIKPRGEIAEVGVGNEVVIILNNEEKPEVFTLLGSADSFTKTGWLSCESPLGSSLIGKKVGEMIIFSVGEKVIKGKILEIRPGKFDFQKKYDNIVENNKSNDFYV